MNSAMEQTRYWMWTKKKLSSGTPLLTSNSFPMIPIGSSYNDSWEERAFAEDAAGHLGGCVWPPRSYSCSFCRREFRSAQALGGHMNVHRRDRARLKQSSGLISDQNDDTTLPLCDPFSPLGVPVCNTDSNPNPSNVVVASPTSPSRLSAVSTQENCSDNTMVSPSYVTPIVRKRPKESMSSTLRSFIDPVPSSNLDLKLGRDNWRIDYLKAISCKRQKIDMVVSPSFVKTYSCEPQQLSPELLLFGSRVVEELDLELRLGSDPPKVK